ncbi:MAG: hypothetical protein EHM56_02810, partial [Chloroflexi bacterium]
MKVKQLLTALLLGVVLAMPVVPAAQPASLALQPPGAALARPAAMPAPHLATALQDDGPEAAALPQEIVGVPGVTEDWWQKVQADILGEIYAFTAEESDGGPPAYRSSNPQQGFEIALTAGSLRLAKSTGAQEGRAAEPGWSWELRTTGMGVEDGVRYVLHAA